MTIREALVIGFKARFPGVPCSIVDGAGWELKVQAPNPQLGFVSVTDDRDEATVFVGELTHGHFDWYDGSLSDDARVRLVSDSVLTFLDDLFHDRVVVWTAGPGRSGGWRVLEEGEAPQPRKGVSSHLWSRPLSQTP